LTRCILHCHWWNLQCLPFPSLHSIQKDPLKDKKIVIGWLDVSCTATGGIFNAFPSLHSMWTGSPERWRARNCVVGKTTGFCPTK
jgi:hypothetical protein